MKRIAPKGADRTDYRRRLNRAYLVLSIIWIFAGLIYPLYQADERGASSELQLKGCLEAADGNEAAVKNCHEQDRILRVGLDARHAFEATYGDVRQWPVSLFLVCILPPMLLYVAIRFIAFAVSTTLPRAQTTHKQS